MSMGAILKQVRDFLRSSLPADIAQCDVRPGGEPPEVAHEWFISVDELAVRSNARNCLDETYEIEISLWRRAGCYPQDRQGDALLQDDPYSSGLPTLDDIERDVIRLLHGNRTGITAAVNLALGTGETGSGDIFQEPLYYAGRRRTEVRGTGRRDSQTRWFVRRLKFTGMRRVQASDVMR